VRALTIFLDSLVVEVLYVGWRFQQPQIKGLLRDAAKEENMAAKKPAKKAAKKTAKKKK
jgi:hypothetical protein